MIKKAILKKKVLIILEKNCLDLLSTGLLGFVTSLNYVHCTLYRKMSKVKQILITTFDSRHFFHRNNGITEK